MWVLEKIKGNMENIPLELSRYMAKGEQDVLLPSQNLPCNILTPDKIPEFCLPPRLLKRNPLLESEKISPNQYSPSQKSKTYSLSNVIHLRKIDEGDVLKSTKKPLPFSAEGYGLAGLYENPNTRRRESLFHSTNPVYTFERSITSRAPRHVKKTNEPSKTLSELFPLLACKHLSEPGCTKSEIQSCSDFSPLTSSYSSKTMLLPSSRKGHLEGAVSCPSLINSKGNKGTSKRTDQSVAIPSKSSRPSTLRPPILFPLDILQCQERLHCEHLIPLHDRGRVRLSAEHTTFSKDTFSSLSTVRVRVVSIEGLWENTERQTLGCAVSLCLTPGKLQQQESATIRNCRNPVFNEDFFFIELSYKNLQDLQLRLKVIDKPAAGALRRGTMIGLIIKPLSELLMNV
ncbi:C2 calcium-dependent domain-containing protein 4C [Gouania willdenowi]|uniref:C2 calcium-dependent domain-containing protein 4C n=1 Tax=Gouania willdenowi TaxID=441366 RepID=UPI001054FAD2|nr:C2 calcium-dependent domain-containing protein 4C-like [Gouania willdenowi]